MNKVVRRHKLMNWLLKKEYKYLWDVFDIFFRYQSDGYIDIFLGTDQQNKSINEYSLVIINKDNNCFHFYLSGGINKGIYTLYINDSGEIYKVKDADSPNINYPLSCLNLIIKQHILQKEVIYQNNNYISLTVTEINQLINLREKKDEYKYEFNFNNEKIFIKISKFFNYESASDFWSSINISSHGYYAYRVTIFNYKLKISVTLLIDNSYDSKYCIINAYATKYIENKNTGFYEFENISKDINEVFDILQNQVAFQINGKIDINNYIL